MDRRHRTDILMMARELRRAIESDASVPAIGERAQQLAIEVGGGRDISTMSPGAAALYILALFIEWSQES